ncbi:hypothetical protein [Candidatus Nitrotoga fabula]|uniref:hypothetical protein n=1 Tax=Candidatus Nitrotoga fabula TaxID=2182327 RepID=UPI001BB47822|nr:hypothetical protein [Candidatus Nitrotoga fabula]
MKHVVAFLVEQHTIVAFQQLAVQHLYPGIVRLGRTTDNVWQLKSGLLHITRHFTVELPQKHHHLYKPFGRRIEISTPGKNIFFIDNVLYIIDLHTSYATKSCG